MPEELSRRLGTIDAIVVGLSAMIGAGVFAAFAPAAAAAGHWLLASLALAAVVAYCNATSSARLAALYPESGGTYVYGRRRLGPLWGYLAGWGFTIGKTASCAAMALTFGAYVAPGLARPLAVGAVAALTALNVYGVRRTAGVARVIVAFVLAVLVAVVVTGLLSDGTPASGLSAHPLLAGGPSALDAVHLVAGRPDPAGAVGGWAVLQAAGLLFFAFAGYARIATLGEEVRDPARTIPRAVGVALAITLVVYALVALAALRVLGPSLLARSPAPLAEVVTVAGAEWLAPVVRAGAAVAALGALLALLLGVSRTVLAMARERDLPGVLAAVDPARQAPRRAELVVGGAVIVLLLVADLREAIGFSSFGVLVYYGIANACALTLRPDEGAPPRPVPVLGLLLCALLAATLPLGSVLAGLAVFAAGLAIRLVRRRIGRPGNG
ncbi:amino acid permease [Nonomuraea phyllanthi]|uniref:APC family permease n=1 Tax=Nonomuraea phyllanthi TaxID=2219224 RepID=UPI0012930CB1|nr:APC family permease [Nonomuraea phyllanthi]QFY12175.1 amino acid permease [Nonomuraea phyllanthi]